VVFDVFGVGSSEEFYLLVSFVFGVHGFFSLEKYKKMRFFGDGEGIFIVRSGELSSRVS
jgi:hypothetical protein